MNVALFNWIHMGWGKRTYLICKKNFKMDRRIKLEKMFLEENRRIFS